MKGIKIALIIFAVIALVFLASYSLKQQKTIRAVAVESFDEAVEKGSQGEIPVEADIRDTADGNIAESAVGAENTEQQESTEQKSPECILLSRKAQIKYEDRKNDVTELERELKRLKGLIELEKDKEPIDVQMLEQLRNDEDKAKGDLEEAQRGFYNAELELREIEKKCGEIIYLE